MKVNIEGFIRNVLTKPTVSGCRMAADLLRQAEQQIDRLTAENAALKAEIEKLRADN